MIRFSPSVWLYFPCKNTKLEVTLFSNVGTKNIVNIHEKCSNIKIYRTNKVYL